MTVATIKKQFDNYLPLLSAKQQSLLLEVAKNLLHIETESKRVSKKQYNKELDEAVARIEKGSSVDHKQALKELAKW